MKRAGIVSPLDRVAHALEASRQARADLHDEILALTEAKDGRALLVLFRQLRRERERWDGLAVLAIEMAERF